MDTKRIGLLAGVVGLLGALAQYVPLIVVDRLVESGFDGIVPTVGTAGQTVATYSYLIDIAGPLVTLVLAVGLGYAVGQRVAMDREYRRVTGAIALGSAAGVIVTGIPVLAGNVSPVTGFTVFVSLAALGSMLVSIALPVTIGALAGAAIAQFEATDPDSFRPTEDDGTDSETPAETTADSTDASRSQSQSTA